MLARRSAAFSLALLLGAASAQAFASPGAAEQTSDEVTLPERDLIEASLAKYLVRPATAMWRFTPKKPYLGTTRLVCGQVNYETSERRYVGYHRFYALLDQGRVTLSQIEDKFEDPSGRLADKLDFLCGKA